MFASSFRSPITSLQFNRGMRGSTAPEVGAAQEATTLSALTALTLTWDIDQHQPSGWLMLCAVLLAASKPV